MKYRGRTGGFGSLPVNWQTCSRRSSDWNQEIDRFLTTGCWRLCWRIFQNSQTLRRSTFRLKFRQPGISACLFFGVGVVSPTLLWNSFQFHSISAEAREITRYCFLGNSVQGYLPPFQRTKAWTRSSVREKSQIAFAHWHTQSLDSSTKYSRAHRKQHKNSWNKLFSAWDYVLLLSPHSSRKPASLPDDDIRPVETLSWFIVAGEISLERQNLAAAHQPTQNVLFSLGDLRSNYFCYQSCFLGVDGFERERRKRQSKSISLVARDDD